MNETNSTLNEASVSDSPVDQIANMFTSVEEDEKRTPEETEVEETEVEASEDIQEDQEQDAPDDDEEETDVTWAGALGIEDGKLVLDDDGNFKAVKVKVDGNESQVDLNTLIAGYQTARSTTQRSQALADQKRAFEAQAQQQMQAYQQKLSEAEQFAGILDQRLLSDYQGIDWNRLRAENPSEYSATMMDFQTRKADIERMKSEIQQNQSAVQQRQQQEFQTKKQSYIQEQTQRTLELFPEWRDPSVAKQAFDEMYQFASRFGYSQEELNELTDSRAIAIMQAAMGAEKKQAAASKKAEKPVPKFRKSTRSRSSKPKATKLDRLVKRAKTSSGANKRRAQTDAIAELLISGE